MQKPIVIKDKIKTDFYPCTLYQQKWVEKQLTKLKKLYLQLKCSSF